MSSTYELNQISITPANDIGPLPAQLIYNLPYPIKLSGYDVALASTFLYYSWPNITAVYGDNLLQYNFPGAGANPYSVAFPDGQYALSDIGNFLEFVMAQNGHYLVDNNGNNVYYISLVANPVYYAVTVTCTPVPAVLPAGWTNPNGIVLSGQTPQLIVPVPSASATYTMNELIGFQSGTYPAAPQATIFQINSNGVGDAGIPQISPVSAVNLNLNLVSSSYFNTNPSTIYSFSPNTTYGSQIQITPYQYVWLKCVDNQFSQIQVTFTDQNGNILQAKDSNIIVNLYLRKTSSAALTAK